MASLCALMLGPAAGAAPTTTNAASGGGSISSAGGPIASTSNAVAHAARCGRFVALARNSTGARKRILMARARTCQVQNRNNRIVLNQVRNAKYVGVRGDGQYVDKTLCASGRFESRITSLSTGTSVSEGRRWIVLDARVAQGGKVFVARIMGITPGPGNPEFSIARRGARWQIGYIAFGKPAELGNVTRTPHRC